MTRIIAWAIQIAAVLIVTRVETSPALVPKALEPPVPPKAPASPPPLPRWIRTRQIRKIEVSTTRTLSKLVKRCTAEVLAFSRVEVSFRPCLGRSSLAAGGDFAGSLDDPEEIARLQTRSADQ